MYKNRLTKIQAIKAVREVSTLGLVEAKQIVDHLFRLLGDGDVLCTQYSNGDVKEYKRVTTADLNAYYEARVAADKIHENSMELHRQADKARTELRQADDEVLAIAHRIIG